MVEINESLIREISILYVEDDKNVLESVLRFLNRRFDRVYGASNGKDGLELFKEYKPDIVITDIQMPIMSGLQMVKHIKEFNPDTPVIITTAYTEIPYLTQAIEIGVDSYISKPIVNEDLYRTLKKSALKFIHRRMMCAKDRLIQTVMDWNPCFSILISGKNLDYVNRTFLSFVGYETMEEFLRHHECIEDFIVAINDRKLRENASERWFRFIIENPHTDHIVYIKPKTSDTVVPYQVKYEYFRDIDQYLFAFICPSNAINNKA